MNRIIDRSIQLAKRASLRSLLLGLVVPLAVHSAEWDVDIQNFAFNPQALEIDVGDTVTWIQRDSDGHTTTSDTGVWSSPLLFLNQTFSHTFSEPGTYPYGCVPHPEMRGSIIVRPASVGEVSVELIQPEPGAVFTVPGSVELEAAVEPGDVEIIHVEFFSGETSLGLVPRSPYVLHQIQLSGAKERPDPVDTPGTGFGTLQLVGNQVHFHLDYRDLKEPATAAHIHGPAGTEGAAGILVDLENHAPGGFGTAGTLAGTATLTPDQLGWLVDGMTYVNVHTELHPPGEIRGQIER